MLTVFIRPCLLLLITCSYANSEKKAVQVKSSIVSPDPVVHTWPAIGDCFVYKVKQDTIIGLVLAAISKEDGNTYYSFLLSGHLFSSVPSIQQFHNAGISGLAVPSAISGSFETTFCRYTIKAQELLSFMDKMILVGKITGFSNKNIFGSSGYMQKPADLVMEYASYKKQNERLKNEMKELQFPTPEYKVFAWNSVLITGNPGEIAKPETIWVLSPKNAHPAAAKLMDEAWFWNEADDLSPFGNDDGSDAFHSFKDWRKDHAHAEPSIFLSILEQRWKISFAHKDITEESALERIEMINPYYRNIDMSIIGVAFGQLVLEGKLSTELKEYGKKALTRTMLPIGTKGMYEGNKTEYIRRLKKMLDILNKF